MKIILFKRNNKEKLTKNKFPGVICEDASRINIKINNNNYYYSVLKNNINVIGYLINKKYNLKIIEIKYHPYKKLILHIIFIKLK